MQCPVVIPLAHYYPGLKVKYKKIWYIFEKFCKNNGFQKHRINFKTNSNQYGVNNGYKTHVMQSFSFCCDVIPEHTRYVILLYLNVAIIACFEKFNFFAVPSWKKIS